MKSPHLLRVDDAPDRFALLIEAARAEGLRIGWLDFAPAEPLPADLQAAAAAGVLRAVAVGGGRTVSVKPLQGEPVLRDLLREHFRGCVLVLVRGGIEAPHLRPAGDSWTVAVSEEAARSYRTEQLVAALRKPHPW